MTRADIPRAASAAEAARPTAAAYDRRDDAALLAGARRGEEAALAAVMRRYNRSLYRLCRAVLGDDSEAEEALQEAYIAAFTSLDQLDNPQSFGAWLRRIAWTRALARRRRPAFRRETAVEAEALERVAEPAASAEAEAMRRDARAVLEAAIDRLQPPFRQVFVMRAVEELSVAETAALLELEPATVKTRHLRARRALRQILEQEFALGARELFPFAGARCDAMAAAVLARLRGDPGGDRPSSD